MGSLQESMGEYRKQLQKGAIQVAYKGLMEYMMGLRTFFYNRYPDHFVSSIYYGYMDMTYFSFVPKSYKQRSLKPAIVFIHEKFRFEAWLAASNKQVQSKYWDLFKQSGWDKYQLVPTTKGYDSILEHILVADADFGDLEALTNQIERGILEFITNVEAFLSEHDN